MKRSFVLFFASRLVGLSREVDVIAAWPSVPYLTSPNPNESLNEASLFEDLALLDLIHPSQPVISTKISKKQPANRNDVIRDASD